MESGPALRTGDATSRRAEASRRDRFGMARG